MSCASKFVKFRGVGWSCPSWIRPLVERRCFPTASRDSRERCANTKRHGGCESLTSRARRGAAFSHPQRKKLGADSVSHEIRLCKSSRLLELRTFFHFQLLNKGMFPVWSLTDINCSMRAASSEVRIEQNCPFHQKRFPAV